MANTKTMFSQTGSTANGYLANGSGNAESEVLSSKPSKKQTIETMYQKKTQIEHIHLRPDAYIGSVDKVSETMWIYDNEKETMIQKNIEYVPGLYKIFDEILVNAADNKQRDERMNCIKIEINVEDNVISVLNNGRGIPIVRHKEENIYVPTMIFGHLLTSSNYNDEEEKVTGGRNGYGAKLCNIFSNKFTVETAVSEYRRKFKQTWSNNMTNTSEPEIQYFFGYDYTKISFSPDLAKFKMDKLDDDIIGLMSRRAFDVAATSRGVMVFLNGKKIPVNSFKDYIKLYIMSKEDDVSNRKTIAYEQCNERWEVALTFSDRGFQQVSFVNSIATTKGGRHVDYITDMIVKQLIEDLQKQNKTGVNIKPFQIKNHMWVFINCLIVNPTFDSQTKEIMTLQMKSFGSKCTLGEKFITQLTNCDIVKSILLWAKFKARKQLAKTSGIKTSKLNNIAKLEDADEAGTKNALKCTLILTEGDSAKSMVVSGLAVIGRARYGIYPLRGKLLNVREATYKQILENQEIKNIIKILGLRYENKYNSIDDMKTLRYGKVMIMTDPDEDGSHIKGLIINFIHHYWPELLKQDFLEQFITPIVKAKKKNECLLFYSLPEFDEWKDNTPNYRAYSVKYYKGLGTSDAREAREYFSNMAFQRIRFRYSGQQDDDHIMLAFSKQHVEHRKDLIMNFLVESRRWQERGLPKKYLYGKDMKYLSYTDFVNKELVLFWNSDNVRSIPSMVDGFKPSQRKVLYVCCSRTEKREMKVGQLMGAVMEKAAYHHGDMSLSMVIVNMAQNYVGSNNINVLEPHGQFGTRLTGGKDFASPRYICTKQSPLTRLIFHPQDDLLLKYQYDDNLKVEPYWYIPILPMILVNGADGVGTGWMTKIPKYNPRDLVFNLRRMLDGEEPKELVPWYKNFKGTVEYCGEGRYLVSGELAITHDNHIEITELPIGTWTSNYKENVLEPMLYGSEKEKSVLTDYKDYSTDTSVKFVISLQNGQLELMKKEGLHKTFKLQTIVNISSMIAFDEYGCIQRYDTVMDILQEFYTLRLKMYQKRKDFLLGMLEAEAAKLNNQARFILEKCTGILTVEDTNIETIIKELINKKYIPDPVREWKQKNMKDEEQEEEDGSKNKNKPESDKIHPDMKKFGYLLGLTVQMLTEDKMKLLSKRDQKLSELEILKNKTAADLWREDLDAFMEGLEKQEKKEKANDVKNKMKKKPGRKKIPSPAVQRIVPTISEDIKSKIQKAVKTKENKMKKQMDEFDERKEKLGTPENAVKRSRREVIPKVKKRVLIRRAATKIINLSDEDSESGDGPILLDNNNNASIQQEKLESSDDDKPLASRIQDKSESCPPSSGAKRKKIDERQTDSEDDMFSSKKANSKTVFSDKRRTKKKRAAKPRGGAKKKKKSSSDDDEGTPPKKSKVVQEKFSDEDDDEDTPPKRGQEVNGSPKRKGVKKKGSSDESDMDTPGSGSDIKFSNVTSTEVKECVLNRNAATKVIKCILSDEDSKFGDGPILLVNKAVINDSIQQEKLKSSDDGDKPPQMNEKSENMFDTLVGRKKDKSESPPPSLGTKRKKIDDSQTDSEDNRLASRKSKSKTLTSDEDVTKKKAVAKPREGAKKKRTFSDDVEDTPSKKTKVVLVKKFSDEDDDEDTLSKKTKANKKENDSDIDHHHRSWRLSYMWMLTDLWNHFVRYLRIPFVRIHRKDPNIVSTHCSI